MKTRTLTATALCFGTLFGCGAPPSAELPPAAPTAQPAQPAAPSSAQAQAPSPAEVEPEAEGPPPFTTLRPAGDYRMHFILLDAEDGSRGVGIAEEMAAGTPPLVDSVGLGHASPLEVFRAFSGPEVKVPPVLQELYSGARPVFAGRARGWALAEAQSLVKGADTSPAVADVACSDAAFIASVIDDLPSRTWRLNQNGLEAHWDQYCDYTVNNGSCGACTNGSRKKYEHVRLGADEWRAYSCVRSAGPGLHYYYCPSGNGTLNPRIRYEYRANGAGSWATAFVSPDSEFSGQNRMYSWHWFTGTNWDWRHSARGAILSGGDKFDLYTAWR